MASNTKISFSKYTKGADCPNEGCLLPFNQFPSNTQNLFVVLSGAIRVDYKNGAVQTYSNPYSNTWSSYIEPWIYNQTLTGYIRSDEDKFLKVFTENTTVSQITFSAAKIVSEEINKTTNKRSFIYIHGTDFCYRKDGIQMNDPNTHTFGISSGHMAGNTSTHSITANSSPVTVVFIEEN